MKISSIKFYLQCSSPVSLPDIPQASDELLDSGLRVKHQPQHKAGELQAYSLRTGLVYSLQGGKFY